MTRHSERPPKLAGQSVNRPPGMNRAGDGQGDRFDAVFGTRRGRSDAPERETTESEAISAYISEVNRAFSALGPLRVPVAMYAEHHGLRLDQGFAISRFAGTPDAPLRAAPYLIYLPKGWLRGLYRIDSDDQLGVVLFAHRGVAKAYPGLPFARFLALGPA